VRAASRDLDRADDVCRAVRDAMPPARVTPCQIRDPQQLAAALDDAHVVIAAGAAGTQLLPAAVRRQAPGLKLAVDLNAVPPLGIEGVEATDKAKSRDGILVYGAIGVGGTKMKIHKAAIQRLFESNDQVLDADQVFALGRELERRSAG
jgi:hypothetical protein